MMQLVSSLLCISAVILITVVALSVTSPNGIARKRIPDVLTVVITLVLLSVVIGLFALYYFLG